MEEEGKRTYSKLYLDLGTARKDWQYEVKGDSIRVESITGKLKVKLDHIGNDEIDLARVDEIRSVFEKLYFTNSAQAGKKATLLLGGITGFGLSPFTGVEEGQVFNTSITANTNIFAIDLVPIVPPAIFRIYACFAAAGILIIRRTRGGVTISENLNAGASLVADAGYMFDIIVDDGDTINLQYSVATTAKKVSVVEVRG